MTLESINPATGATVARYEEDSPAEVGRALDSLSAAHAAWRRTDLARRADVLRSMAGALRADRESHARLMTAEMGKPIGQARAEVDKCAWVCEYYAAQGAHQLGTIEVEADAARSLVVFQPLGTVLAVMPWNFPFWQVFRCAAPALMAGNVMALKHASNVTGCALAIEATVASAWRGQALLRALKIPSPRVAGVVADARIQAVTLTGSTEAGRAVAGQAGAALKRTVLELGGSDPYVVLEDADVAEAARICASARLVNSGQSCIAAKRFVVVRSVHEPFLEAFVDAMASARLGDPLDEQASIGPLARPELRSLLHRQVTQSVAMGASLLLGGEVPDGPGAYYPATVLSEVVPGMPVFDEETFGPVAPVIAARDEADALRLANASAFGLGAAVFTRDAAKGIRIASGELDAGSCFVNGSVRSDPRLPFGGIKASGYGRELSEFGIREFTNVKTVVVG